MIDEHDLRAGAALVVPVIASVAGASVFMATAGRGSMPTIQSFAGMTAVMLLIVLIAGAIIPRIGSDPA